ncbi:MAG: DUF4363 family protein [Clostridia bacterium]|nr:DUF4363 family protein [Clostridia bacterium]
MKNAIMLVVALAILIISGIWQIRYIEESSIYAISDTQYVVNLINNDDFVGAKKHINELKNTWEEMRDIWNIFIIHDEIDEIEEIMVNFEMYTKLENKEEALVYSERLKRSFTHVSKKQKIKIENVF